MDTVGLHGQYVAQLASKYDGIPDPAQTAADGSHTFRNTDILTEFQRLKGMESSGVRVLLLLSTDYGDKHLINGHVLWVTFAEGSFSNPDDVRSWCARQFAPRTGKALLDVCTARQLNPPS